MSQSFIPPRPPSVAASNVSGASGYDHIMPHNASSLEDSTYDFLSDAGRSDSSAQTESIASMSEHGDETSSTGYAFDSDLEDTEDEGEVVRHRRRLHTPLEDDMRHVEVMVVGTDVDDVDDDSGTDTDDEDVRELLNSDLKNLTVGRSGTLVPNTQMADMDDEDDDKRPKRLLDIISEYVETRKGEMFRLVFFFVILLGSTIATSNVIESGHAWWQSSKGQMPTSLLSSSHLRQENQHPAVVQVPKQAGTMEASAPPIFDVLGRAKDAESGLGQLLASLDLISEQSKAILSNLKAASSSLSLVSSSSSTSSSASASSASSAVASSQQQPLPISNGPNALAQRAKLAAGSKTKNTEKVKECPIDRRKKLKHQRKKEKQEAKAAKKAKSTVSPTKEPQAPRLSLPFPQPLLGLPEASLALARAQDRAVLVAGQVAAVAARGGQAAEQLASSVADKAEQAWDQAMEKLRDTENHQRIMADGFEIWHGMRGRAVDGAGEAVRMTAWATGRFRAKWEEVSEFLGTKAEEMELEKRIDEARKVGEQGLKNAREALGELMRDHGREVGKVVKGAAWKKLDKAHKRARILRRMLGKMEKDMHKMENKVQEKKSRKNTVKDGEDGGRRWTRYGFVGRG